MNVAALLRSKGNQVITIAPEASVAEVVRILADHRIGAVVVSRDGQRVDGILSERDIVNRLAKDHETLPTLRVRDIMTTRVSTCGLGDELADLMAVMTARRIRHIPVIEDGALCGIVSIGDVVKWRVEEIEREAEALRAYVAQA
ncbi:MAG TPA: CBS domain-containing protein [Alphaproteobacteria bacterium]|jgi:CBS domain-containing protein|nr:CBS domain-containing protein [Alphaproteobacteria bacterium]